MFIYIAISVLLLILALRYDNKASNGRSETWVSVVFWILVLLAGLRNHVGADTFNYEYHFYDTPTLNHLFNSHEWLLNATQPLWFVIRSALRTVWDNFVILTLFHAVVFNYLLFRYLKNTTHYFFTSLFFIFCMQWWYFNFEIIRESLCIVMILNGCVYLRSDNRKGFALFCIPTIFIHYFAFIPIAFILLFHYLKPKYALWICIFTVLLFYSMNMESFQTIALQYAFASANDTKESFERYLYGEYAITNLNAFGYLKQIFKIIPAFFVVQYLYKKTLLLDCKLVLLYLLCFLVSIKVPMLDRFCDYFFVVYVVYVAEFLYDKSIQSRKIISLFFVYAFLSFTWSFYTPTSIDEYNSNVNIRYIPYKSIFQDEDPLREAYFQRQSF